MICKICGRDIHYKSMKKHLKTHSIDIFSYSKDYSSFYSLIMDKKLIKYGKKMKKEYL